MYFMITPPLQYLILLLDFNPLDGRNNVLCIFLKCKHRTLGVLDIQYSFDELDC